MFLFSRKKSFLVDLIPDGYVDIHSHIIHSLDDGAQNIEDSTFLVESMLAMNFSKSIATPHTLTYVWDNSKENILEKYNNLKTEIPDLTHKIDLSVASEYLMDDTFLGLLEKSEILTLKDNIILVEMSYLNPPINLYDIIYKIQLAGYTPILAHPERYTFYHRNFDEFEKLKKAGCKFQLNLLSIVGYYGKDVFEIAQKLLSKRMYDFTGSDIHHEKHVTAFKRPVLLRKTDGLTEILKHNIIFK